jgi:hypothetical protein
MKSDVLQIELDVHCTDVYILVKLKIVHSMMYLNFCNARIV